MAAVHPTSCDRLAAHVPPIHLPNLCRIVGTANAVAAGWGNSAGGFVQLLMPLLLEVR